jgi:hypothetical protein
MTNILAFKTVRSPTDITLNALVFCDSSFIEGNDVGAILFI